MSDSGSDSEDDTFDDDDIYNMDLLDRVLGVDECLNDVRDSRCSTIPARVFNPYWEQWILSEVRGVMIFLRKPWNSTDCVKQWTSPKITQKPTESKSFTRINVQCRKPIYSKSVDFFKTTGANIIEWGTDIGICNLIPWRIRKQCQCGSWEMAYR